MLLVLGFGLFGAMLGFVSASIIMTLTCFVFFTPKVRKGNFHFPRLLAFSFPVLMFTLFTNIFLNFNVLAIKALSNANANLLAGQFNAAMTIAVVPLFVSITISSLFFPSIAKKQNNKKMSFNFTLLLKNTLIFIAPFVAIIALNASRIIQLLYSNKYLPATPSLVVLSIAFFLYSLFYVFSNALVAANNQAKSMALAFILLLINFIVSILLIPRQGIYGASLAVLISCFIACVLVLIYSKIKFSFKIPWKTIICILIALIPVYFISQFSFSFIFECLKYLVCLLIYFGVLSLLKEFKFKELISK